MEKRVLLLNATIEAKGNDQVTPVFRRSEAHRLLSAIHTGNRLIEKPCDKVAHPLPIYRNTVSGQKDQVSSRGSPNAQIESPSWPVVNNLNYLFYGKFFRSPNCGVVTSIINQYHLEIGKFLGEDRPQTRSDPTLLIVGTNYNRSRLRLVSHRFET
jgi:hypothetical protein